MSTKNVLSKRQFIYSYFITIIIPMVILIIIVQAIFINKIYENTKNELCEDINYVKVIADKQFENFKDITEYFYFKNNIDYANMPGDYFNYLELCQDLDYVSNSNMLISECAVYSPKSRYIFSNESSYMLRYFLDMYRIDGYDENTLYDYLNNIKQNERIFAINSTTKEKCTIFLYPQFSAKGEHLRTMIFITPESYYKKILNSSSNSNVGCIYISDSDGNIIAGINNDTERNVMFYKDIPKKSSAFEYEDAFINTLDSDYVPVSYTLVIRQSAIVEKTLYLRYLWGGIVLLIIVIAIIIAIISSKINYKPILNLKSRISEFYDSASPSQKNDFNYLSDAMEYMNQKNILLQNNLNDINKYIIIKLLSGQYSNDAEIIRIGNLINVSTNRSLFRVLLIKDHQKKGYRELYKACLSILPETINFLIYEDGENFVLILAYSLSQIGNTEIPQFRFDEQYDVSFGNLQTDVRWIPLSYAEAYCGNEDINEHILSFESALLSANLKSAKFYLAKCIEFLETASINEAIPICVRTILLIQSAFRNSHIEVDISNLPDIFMMLKCNEMEYITDLLKNEIYPLIDYLSDPEMQDHGDTHVEIMKYVKQHYCDMDFSLKKIADYFGILPSTISRRFSEITGMNLLDYITNMKINKAINLLHTTDMSINDISMAVGYYSVNSFIRRFKQITGLTPGEYRQKGGVEELNTNETKRSAIINEM